MTRECGTKQYGVGIIGCGNISGAYFKLIPLYRNLKLVACADINPAASKARSEEFGVAAQEIDDLLENLAAIHPRLRSIVEMKVFEGLSMDEIADRLQIAPRTAARNWTFCKQWLREHLGVKKMV